MSTRPGSRCSLPDGLALRTAGPADLEQIERLLAERGEPADAVDLRLVVQDPDAGWSACAVIVDGDKVVSTATLLDETLYLSGVEIPAGQVELVATDAAYEGRGLVRALMQWAHHLSSTRGHLMQIMIGIPYFYRLFGYVYAPAMAATRPLASIPPVAAGHVVREATAADIGSMVALQAAAQEPAELRVPHSPACWRWLVSNDATVQWLVERSGVPVAIGRSTPPGDSPKLAEIAGVDVLAIHALTGHIAAAGDQADRVQVNERPGTVVEEALAPHLGPAPEQLHRYYVRVPDPIALLEHLRPALTARLAAAPPDEAEGEALISFYRSHVRFDYGPDGVGSMRGGGTMQWPADGGAAVPPDVVGPLLFGEQGFAGLERIHPDMWAGRHEHVMWTLFPPIACDVLSFYLP